MLSRPARGDESRSVVDLASGTVTDVEAILWQSVRTDPMPDDLQHRVAKAIQHNPVAGDD